MTVCLVSSESILLSTRFSFVGFVTEVHHINEKAEDAGVVYAEVGIPAGNTETKFGDFISR